MGIRRIQANRNLGENCESKLDTILAMSTAELNFHFILPNSMACMIAPDWILGTRDVSCSWVMPLTRRLRYAPLPPHQKAAHLTQLTQHLGQGANQTFEDIYYLTRLLGAHPGAAEDSATLEKVFTEYEHARIPRSSMLIEMARKQGESRVVEGVEACLVRNQQVRAFMSDEGVMAMYAELYGDLVAKRSAL